MRNVSASSAVTPLVPKADIDVEDQYFDSQENFQEPRSWWHGQDSSCEGESDSDDTDNTDRDLEGGGLEEILTWPPELLFQCRDHVRWRPKGGNGNKRRRENTTALREVGTVSVDDGWNRGSPPAADDQGVRRGNERPGFSWGGSMREPIRAGWSLRL
jgi:hypothetical protein